MSDLNKLEKAVLQAMRRETPNEDAALEMQISNATVRKRENTGAGFYSYIDVPTPDKLLMSRTISNVFAEVSGMKNPMTFVLFIRDGKIAILEGAAVEDDTFNIDFSRVEFRII